MRDFKSEQYKYIRFKGEGYRRYSNPSAKQEVADTVKTETNVHGTYGALLFDSRWKEKRAIILIRDQHTCVICKGNQNLQVHHRQYHFIEREAKFKPPWDYESHLLITLCENCHNRGHNKYTVPIINV